MLLRRALYGLKQSGRQWYVMLSKWLITQQFTQASFDPCVFLSSDLIARVYVNDLLLANTDERVCSFLSATSSKFNFKDLGRPRYYAEAISDHFAAL